MATVGSLREQLIRETGDYPADPVLTLAWMQGRYAQVLESAPWSFLEKEATFSTVAAITAGTVTVTLGSATVSETTTNANGWSSSVEGRYFRKDGDSEFYPIDTFTNGTPDTLTLNRVYEGASGSTKGYTIFQRFYSLASDCRQIKRITVIDSPTPMEFVSMNDLDIGMVNRPAEGNPPKVWCHAGRDSSDNMRIEVYPIPDEAHGILYHYVQETPSLADDDTSIIAQVDVRLLRSGWMADYWSWRAAFNNAPQHAIVMSQKFENEFDKRLNEMLTRELGNFAPMKARYHSSRWAHRVQGKFGRAQNTVLMPDED